MRKPPNYPNSKWQTSQDECDSDSDSWHLMAVLVCLLGEDNSKISERRHAEALSIYSKPVSLHHVT